MRLRGVSAGRLAVIDTVAAQPAGLAETLQELADFARDALDDRGHGALAELRGNMEAWILTPDGDRLRVRLSQESQEVDGFRAEGPH